MQEFDIDELHSLLTAGFVDDPSIWRNTSLIPGSWAIPYPGEAADFLIRLVDDYQRDNLVPLPVLFRPLGVKCMELSLLPLTLWQVTLNVDFDIGVLDIIERRDSGWEWPKSSNKRRHRNSNIFRERESRKSPSLSKRNIREESGNLVEINGCDRMVVSDVLAIFDAIGDDSLMKGKSMAPNEIFEALLPKLHNIHDTQAIECAALCVGLSRRDGGRLRVVYPNDFSAVVPTTDKSQSELASMAITPKVDRVENGISVSLTAAYQRGLFEVVILLTEGNASIVQVKKQYDIDEVPPEILVGPVRFSNMKAPDSLE